MGDFENLEFTLTITHEDGTIEVVDSVGLSNIPEIKDCLMPAEVIINGVLYRRAE